MCGYIAFSNCQFPEADEQRVFSKALDLRYKLVQNSFSHFGGFREFVLFVFKLAMRAGFKCGCFIFLQQWFICHFFLYLSWSYGVPVTSIFLVVAYLFQ